MRNTIKSKDKLIKEYETLAGSVAQRQQAINNLEQQKSNLQRELSGLQQKTTQSQNLKLNINTLNNQIKSLQYEIKKIQPKVNLLKRSYDEAKAQNSSTTELYERKINEFNETNNAQQEYDNLLANFDAILCEFSDIQGVRVNTDQMVIEVIPKSQLTRSKALEEACKKKCMDSFKMLINKLDDVNAVDSNGMNLFMYCIKHNFWEGVEILMTNDKVDYDATDNNGCNILMYFCVNPNRKFINKIIDKVKNVNAVNNKEENAWYILCKNINSNVNVCTKEIDNQIKGVVTTKNGEMTIPDTNITINSIIEIRALETCQALVKKGLNLYSKNASGLSFCFALYLSQKHQLIQKMETKFGFDWQKNDNTGFERALGYILCKDSVGLENFIKQHPTCITATDNFNETLIHYATRSHYIDGVKILHKHGASLMAVDNGNLTALFKAVYTENMELIKTITELEKKAINIPNSLGFSPIYIAIHKGRSDILNYLIQNGINVNPNDNPQKISPLHYATGTYSGGGIVNEATTPEINSQIIKYLIDNGANLRTQNNEGLTAFYIFTYLGKHEVMDLMLAKDSYLTKIPNKTAIYPIHAAIHYGQLEAIKILNKYGANLNEYSNDKNVEPPLTYALGNYSEYMPKLEIINYLLDNGVDQKIKFNNLTALIKAIYINNPIIVKALLDNNTETIEIANNNGYYPIHTAIHYGYLEIIKLLVSYKANINAHDIDKKSVTPLYYSMGYEGQKIDPNIIDYLLKNGADPNIPEFNGDTAMHMAAYLSRVDFMEKLIAYGGKIDNVNHAGENLLFCCLGEQTLSTNEQRLSMVKYLLSQNMKEALLPKLNIQQKYLDLWLAAKFGTVDEVQQAINNGADINISVQNKNNTTPLIEAVSRKKYDVIEKLCQQPNIDINKSDKDGFTPIYYAVMGSFYLGGGNENKEIIELLIKYNADVTIANSVGHQPIHTASNKCNLEIIQALEAAGSDINVFNNSKLNTPLIHAFYSGNKPVIKYYLSKGCNINHQGKDGTALHNIIISTDLNTEQKISLIKRYISLFDLTITDEKGNTAMDLAKEKCPEIMPLLGNDSVVLDITEVNNQANQPVVNIQDNYINGMDDEKEEIEVLGDI